MASTNNQSTKPDMKRWHSLPNPSASEAFIIIADNPEIYISYINQVIAALKSIPNHNSLGLYQLDLHFVSPIISHQPSRIDPVKIHRNEAIQCGANIMTFEEAINFIQNRIKTMRDKEYIQYIQDVMIIDRNGNHDKQQDIVYIFNAMRRAYFPQHQDEQFCIDNMKGDILHTMNTTDRGIITLSFQKIESKLRMFYNYGYGNGEIRHKISEHQIVDKLLLLFDAKYHNLSKEEIKGEDIGENESNQLDLMVLSEIEQIVDSSSIKTISPMVINQNFQINDECKIPPDLSGVINRYIHDGKQGKKELFIPSNGFRARFNVYISKELTKELILKILPQFKDKQMLYYYLDYSTWMQVNDEEATIYNTGNKRIVIINYDICDKRTENVLYGIIEPNDNEIKYEWKMIEFCDKEEIFQKYYVSSTDLPSSSRQTKRFKTEIGQNVEITQHDIESIKSYKSLTKHSERGRKYKIIDVTWRMFKQYAIKSLCICSSAIPNIRFQRKHKKHWIEWVFIVDISDKNVSCGISFKYDKNKRKNKAISLCLNKRDIENQYALTGLSNPAPLLNQFRERDAIINIT